MALHAGNLPLPSSADALSRVVQVIRLALQDAGVAPSDVGALEMHGTGTPLGDPIEVGAAATVLAEGRSHQGSSVLGLSAVKNALGHSEPAAGAVGMHRAMSRCAVPTQHPLGIGPFSVFQQNYSIIIVLRHIL